MKRFIWLFLLASALACGTPEKSDRDEMSAVEAEVTAFLQRYTEALADPSNPSALAGLYVADDRFSWYEDGQLRYSAPEKILETLEGFPAGTAISTKLTETTILPLPGGRALVNTLFSTRFSGAQGMNFAFSGAMTMLVERSPEGWKVVCGHSSSVR